MSRQTVRTPSPAGALDIMAEQLIARYPGKPRAAMIELRQHLIENEEKYRKLEYKPISDILEDAERRIFEANEEEE